MKLIDDAGKVLRRAWSVRLGIVAGVLSGAEVIVPLFSEEFPRNVFSLLAFTVATAAFIARFIAQPKMHDD